MRHILIIFTAALFGQVAFASPTVEKKRRTCRILFLARPDDAPEKAFLHDGMASHEVSLPGMNLSDVYELPAGTITLRMLPRQPADQETVPTGAPAVVVPEAVKNCYLLVASDPDNKVMPVRIQIVNADPNGFRKGQMMWINLSPYTVGGVLGASKLKVAPKSMAIIPPPAKTFENYQVDLGYLPDAEKPAEPLCTTLWRHNPESRSVVFVMSSPNSRIPQIRSFLDARIETDVAAR